MKKIILIFLLSVANIMFIFAEITDTDLLLANSVTEELFPEQDYSGCPSVLTGIEGTMMLPYIYVDVRRDSLNYERTDDSVGNDGGTYDYSLLDISPELSYTSFFLLESGNVFGFDAGASAELYYSRKEDNYYSSASSNSLTTCFEKLIAGGSDFYYSFFVGDSSSLGFKLGYDFTWSPAAFETILDSSSSEDLTYYNEYSSDSKNYDEYLHELSSSMGYSFKISDSDINIGLAYQGVYDDRNNVYTSIDSDDDNYDESLVSLYDYYTGQDGTTSYEYHDYSIYNNVDLNASSYLPVKEDFGIVLSGSYSILDYLYNYQAEHLLDSTTTSDSSYETETYSSGLGSFGLMAALDFKDKEKKSSFRVGIAYNRYAQIYSQDSMNQSGTSSSFSSGNTGNLTELSLGTSPSNDVLSSDNSLDPAETIIHTGSILARYKLQPATGVGVYMDFTISGYHSTDTYQAYNTDTNSVWEEIVNSDGLDWNIGSYCSVALPVNEKWLCSLGIDSDLSTGSFDNTIDSLPYLLSSGEDSDSGDDLVGGTDLELSFTLKLVYSPDKK